MKKTRSNIIISAFIFFSSVGLVGAEVKTEIKTEPPPLPQAELIIFAFGAPSEILAEFQVEIANTTDAIRQGLMFRTALAENAGMVFILRPPRVARFWMRNTFVPLDMIFIKAGGEIESIITRPDTRSDVSTRSRGKVAYVLEINAGLAAQKGIKVGHFIHFSETDAR